MRLISSLLLTLSFSALAQTKTTPESLLFLDLNNNPKEIAVAKAQAQAKKVKLVVYPDGKEQFSREKLKELIKTTNFKTLVVSGHNGGASYHGDYADLEINDLVSMVQDSPNAKKVEALYLLGCNGANKSKIYFWKEGLPSLGMIAGYDGTAPLGSNQKGLDLFSDTLAKQNKILHGKNKTEIKGLLDSLNSVTRFPSSVYVSCTPEHQEYLYLPSKGKERLSKLNSAECTTKITEFKTKYLTTIKKYMSAELEPTTADPSKGFLKEAYVFLRQNEHCLASKEEQGAFENLSADTLLFLRFNKAYTQNFLEYYKDFLKDELAKMELLMKDSDAYAEDLRKELVKNNEDYTEFNDHPEKYQPEIDKADKVLDARKEALLKSDPAFAACVKHPVSSCSRFLTKFMEVSAIDTRKEGLKGWKQAVAAQVADVPSLEMYKGIYKDHSASEHTKVLRELYAKAVNEPEKMTRKDILNISKNMGNIPQLSRVRSSSKLQDFIRTAESLDGFRIPFSWHERLPNKKVEDPNSYHIRKKGYFTEKFPKELESLGRLLDSEQWY